MAGMQEHVNQEASFLDQPEPAQPEPAQPAPEAAKAEAAAPPALPLAGDYQGMGGPQSVPLYSPQAFERPPVTRTILDEIFMEPSDKQLDAFYRVVNKGKVSQNINRLKWAIFTHYSLLFLLLCKL